METADWWLRMDAAFDRLLRACTARGIDLEATADPAIIGLVAVPSLREALGYARRQRLGQLLRPMLMALAYKDAPATEASELARGLLHGCP